MMKVLLGWGECVYASIKKRRTDGLHPRKEVLIVTATHFGGTTKFCYAMRQLP